MKNVFRIVLTTFFVSFFLQSKGEIGLGDWQSITPGNNTIDNYSGDGITLFLSNGKEYKKLEKLEKWYFFKGFVIGIRSGSYFIANEKTLQIDSFDNSKQWLDYRVQNKIVPKLWTRWYITKWDYYKDFGFYLLIWFFISGPLILLFFVFVYLSIRYEKVSPKKPFTLIVFLIIVVTTTTYVLELFPQSI